MEGKDTKKIIFLDLDGTLLNDKKEISEGNAAAITKALAQGHKVVISTGRSSSSALDLAKRLHLDKEGCYAITYNGGCIYDIHKQLPIYKVTVPRSYVRYLMDVAHEVGIHIQTYSETDVIAERDNADLQKYLIDTHMAGQVVPDACTALTEDPCKVLVVDYFNRGLFPTYEERIQEWAAGKVDTFYSCKELLEIVPPGVSKGKAIIRLCEHLQIPMENTISAGDAQNDITMLQTTHVSVVMRNAVPEMYKYGNYITENDNNHDGIAEVIEKFML